MQRPTTKATKVYLLPFKTQPFATPPTPAEAITPRTRDPRLRRVGVSVLALLKDDGAGQLFSVVSSGPATHGTGSKISCDRKNTVAEWFQHLVERTDQAHDWEWKGANVE